MIERDVVLSAMSFFFIHVKTGVIFGFIKDAKNEFRMKLVFYITKAGDGNRTHVSSLEGWCSTIELHPHDSYYYIHHSTVCQQFFCFFYFFIFPLFLSLTSF